MFLDIFHEKSNEKEINKYLYFLFGTNFFFQIIKYIYPENSYINFFLLGIETLTIFLFLYFTQKNNIKSNRIKNFIYLYGVFTIITFISRQYIGFPMKNNILSLITDITSLLVMNLYYYVIVEVSIKKEDIEKILMIFLYMVLFFITYALVFQFNEIIILLTESNPYASNFSSLFVNRNSFALFLFLYYSVFIFQIDFYINKIGKKNTYIVLILVLLSMGLTLSRSSIISTLLLSLMLIGNIIFKILKKETHKLKNIILFLFFFLFSLILLLIIINNEEIINILLNKIFRINYKTSGRTDIWKIGFENLKLNWIFGIGSFQSIGTIDNPNFHNTLVEVLVRNGVLGLVLKLGILFMLLHYHFKSNLKNIESKKYTIMFLLSLLFLLQFESILLFKLGFFPIILLFLITVFNRQQSNIKNKKIKYRIPK